jgi:hypothetical protein
MIKTRSGSPSHLRLHVLHAVDDQCAGGAAVDLNRRFSVQVRMVPVQARGIVRGHLKLILKRRIGVLDVGIENLVLMAHRRNIESMEMDIGGSGNHGAAIARIMRAAADCAMPGMFAMSVIAEFCAGAGPRGGGGR